MATTVEQLAGNYELDPVHSSIEFAVRHLQVSTFRASFADADARLTVENGSIELEGFVRVESVSIVEPAEFRAHVVDGFDFFDASRHPLIAFRSTSVDLREDGTAVVAGELDIRGRTRSVTAAGSYQAPRQDPFGAQRAGLGLRATVDRRDWGMDWQAPLPGGGDALGWEVEISVQLELIASG